MPTQLLQFSELVLKYVARLGYSVWSSNENYNIAFVAAWVPIFVNTDPSKLKLREIKILHLKGQE